MQSLNALQAELKRRYRIKLVLYGSIGIALIAAMLGTPTYVFAENIETDPVYTTTVSASAIDETFQHMADGSVLFQIPSMGIDPLAIPVSLKVNINWKGVDSYVFHVANWAATDQGFSCTRTAPSTTVVNEQTCTHAASGFLDTVSNYNGNLAIRVIRFSGTGNSADIDAISVQLTYDNSAMEDADLTVQTFGPYSLNQTIAFLAEWANLTFDARYLFFYEDVEETIPEIIVENYPMGSTSEWNFTHQFNYAGTFNPFVYVGNQYCTTVTSTGAITGSGCVLVDAQASAITIYDNAQLVAQDEYNYASTFTGSKLHDVIVDEPVSFGWSLNANFCSDSSISGKRLFLGYHPELQYLDSGSILPVGLTGQMTRTFDRTNAPYSDFFFPWIRVYCANGSSKDLYLGGTVNKVKAQGISVYEATDVRFALPGTWLNGGGNVNFAAGTGSYFASDKHLYLRGEQVKLKYIVNEAFTIDKIELYDDQGGHLLRTFTGSAVTENYNHYTTIAYSLSGEYYPNIKVCSASCAQSKTYYLGGETQPNPEYAIIVSDQRSTIGINSGSILGTFSGTGGKVPTQGIFGLMGNFQGFGSTGNTFLDTAQGLLLVVVYAAQWVAGKIYVILSASSLFSFVFSIIHPEAGAQYVLPSTWFCVSAGSCFTMPAGLAGTQFTVSYVSGANAQNMYKLVQLAFAITVFVFVTKQLFFHKKRDV